MLGLPNKSGFVRAILGCLGWACVCAAQAGQYQLLLGQTQSVPIAVPVRSFETQCLVQLQVADQLPIERVVKAPLFETVLVIRPGQMSPVAVRWAGQSKRVGNEVVNACPSEGETALAVVDTNARVVSDWNALFARLGPVMTECVRYALEFQQVRAEWFDLQAPETSGEDAKIKAAIERCPEFVNRPRAWGAKDAVKHACVLSGGLKTQCEGLYVQPTAKGAAQTITKQQAIALHLQGLPWTTAVREHTQVKAQRLNSERMAQLKLQAQEAAEQAAQAKQIADEQERQQAQAKAVADKAEAEKRQAAEEKELKEQERLANRSWIAKTLDDLKTSARKSDK